MEGVRVTVLPLGVISVGVGVSGVVAPSLPPDVEMLVLFSIVAPGMRRAVVGGPCGGEWTLNEGVTWLGLQVSSILSWIQAREAASSLLQASSPLTTSCCSCNRRHNNHRHS